MKHAANYIIQGIFVLAMLFPIQPQYAHADNGISIECQQRKTNKKKVVAKRSTMKHKATVRKFSQKELDKIVETIDRNRKNSQAPMTYMYGTGKNCVDVYLRWNTKENQRKFLRYVCNSSAIKFNGNLDPVIDNNVGVNSYNGITIKPTKQSYPANSTEIEFTITNESGATITYGERFYVTAQDEKGDWYRLPGPGVFTYLGHMLGNGKSSSITATLLPKVLENKPGIYRFFFHVNINGKKVWLMTNFTLK